MISCTCMINWSCACMIKWPWGYMINWSYYTLTLAHDQMIIWWIVHVCIDHTWCFDHIPQKLEAELPGHAAETPRKAAELPGHNFWTPLYETMIIRVKIHDRLTIGVEIHDSFDHMMCLHLAGRFVWGSLWPTNSNHRFSPAQRWLQGVTW